MKRTQQVAALLTSVAFSAPLAAAPVGDYYVISTLEGESSTIASWGLPDTSAYGQTFTISEALDLSTVTFRINDRGNSINYDLYVYAWDAESASATGEVLATGSGSTAGTDEMADVVTATSGGLEAGEYIVLLQATSDGSAYWGSSSDEIYADGSFVYQNNSDDASQHTASSWSLWYGSDLAYELTFGEFLAAITTSGIDKMAAATVGAMQILTTNQRSMVSSKLATSFTTRAESLPYTLGTKSVEKKAPGMVGKLFTWAELTGFYASDDDTDRSYRGAGVQFGADVEISPNLIAGVSIGADTIAAAEGTLSHEGEMYFLQPYLGYRNGDWAGEASLIFGKGSFDQADIGGEGEGDSRVRALTLSGSRDIRLEDATITPSIGLTVGTQTVEGTGGTLAGSGKTSVDFSQVSVGGRYSRPRGVGALFVGLYADYSQSDAATTEVSDLLVDDGWTGRVEFGGNFLTAAGTGLDTSVEFGGLGGDLTQISGGVKATFRF